MFHIIKLLKRGFLIFYFNFRFSEVHEVVNAIIFLLSDKASMINGVELPIDGGFLAT